MGSWPSFARRIAFFAPLALAMLAGCAGAPPAAQTLNARDVMRLPQPWPTAMAAANDAPPRVLSVFVNETAIANGDHWRGRIATSTNVASVEIRTESFSFAAQRTTFGEFTFDVHVLDMPPQYRRGYMLQIIARNAGGARDERYVPIRFL
ncbi:hypothetical protein EPN44_06245 [bacterium]|nr:MAG: hypothetical protein EPN44_06245 [bacterium]